MPILVAATLFWCHAIAVFTKRRTGLGPQVRKAGPAYVLHLGLLVSKRTLTLAQHCYYSMPMRAESSAELNMLG
jgi:hypothetical protein